MNRNEIAKVLLLNIVALSAVGAIAVHRSRRKKMASSRTPMKNLRVMPRLVLGESGRVEQLERFSHYVARQIGFEDMHECPNLLQLACDYLRKAKGCEENIFAFFADETNAESLCIKLIQELDKCVYSYFSFHWAHAPLMVSQELTSEGEPNKRLKSLVLEATRKQRFERLTKNLKVASVFTTLWEQMKAIGSDVMVPEAHSDRRPVLLLLGGGMGAGKSTILKEILLKEAFWSGAAANAVPIEADAFKETDLIYRAISSRGHHHDMLQTAELVHQSSTDAASSLLVTALNEGRDVIMDGTLSWEPFVEQMIAMARNIHRQRYRMGIGYKVAEDGSIIEDYWEQVEEEQGNESYTRKPYRIELVGVICEAHVAVARGIRRAITTSRAVRVKSQLVSHQRFANAFPRYCQLVDNVRLYCTNPIGSTKLIAWKNGSNSLLQESQQIKCLERIKRLNEDANSIFEVYPEEGINCEADSIWKEMVMSPTREMVQQELKSIIKKIENDES